MATPRPLSICQATFQKYTLIFASKLNFKGTSSAYLVALSSPFFQGEQMAPRFSQTVDGGGGTPGLFPTTHYGLCIFLFSLHTPTEPPSEVIVPQPLGQFPLITSTVKPASPPALLLLGQTNLLSREWGEDQKGKPPVYLQFAP